MTERTGDIWNKKAEKFPRFSDDREAGHFKRAAFFENCGVCFDNAEILDVGCGTGRYALLFAPKAKRVDALDVSEGMLKVLNDEAQKRGYGNIRTLQNDFSGFGAEPKSYDVVFTSMTPAVQKPEEVQKILDLARNHWAYIGWGRKRKNPLVEAIFADHGIEMVVPKGAPHVQKILADLGHSVEVTFIEESWNHEGSLEESVEDIAWHVEINGGKPDRDLIRSRLEPLVESDGKIRHTAEVEVGVFVLHLGRQS